MRRFLREKVQSLALGIQSYSDTEFWMHLALYNKLWFTDFLVAVNGVKGRPPWDPVTCPNTQVEAYVPEDRVGVGESGFQIRSSSDTDRGQ